MKSFRPVNPPLLIAEWWRAGVHLAGAHAFRQAEWQRQLAGWMVWPGPHHLDRALRAALECFSGMLVWPLDLFRFQHAAAVRAGFLPRSLLASHRFEQQLGRIERLALGPLARGA